MKLLTARQMIAMTGAQCFTDLKLIVVLLRYHLCAISVLVAACTAAVPVPMFLGEIGAVRRDRCQSERSKARWGAVGT